MPRHCLATTLLVALIGLSTACDKTEQCTTDDDCFSGERCVKATGAATGSCDRNQQQVDMPALSDMDAQDAQTIDMEIPPGVDMNMPDLPPSSTLAQCLSAGCEIAGSCVVRGGEVRCLPMGDVAVCLDQRVLPDIDPQLPILAQALTQSDANSVVIAGTSERDPAQLRWFKLSDSTMIEQFTYKTPAAVKVEALTNYEPTLQDESIIIASSLETSVDVRDLSLLLVSEREQRELLRGWTSAAVDGASCNATEGAARTTQLCAGAPIQLRAAPLKSSGEGQDLILAACLAHEEGDANVLLQLRPHEAPMMGSEALTSAALNTCSEPTQGLSITELKASLGGDPSASDSSGHVWTLHAQPQPMSQPVVRRYDWRGSDTNAGVSSAQFAFQQTELMGDGLLLNKVRAACGVDSAAVWEMRSKGLVLGSRTDRDEFIYLGIIAGRAVAVRHHLTADTTTILCPMAWDKLRWVDAVQAADGWVAVGKRMGERGAVIIRGKIVDDGQDTHLTHVIASGEDLEPLALTRHISRTTSLIVRRGSETSPPVSHIYLNDDGAPACP